MNTRYLFSRFAVMAAGLSTFGAAHADVITASSFFGSQQVTDVTAPVTTSTANLAASGNIGQFDAATGVLMGASLNLTSTRTQTISGAGTTGAIGGSTTTGSGSTNRFNFSTVGVSENFLGVSTSGSCSAARNGNCTYGPISDGGTAATKAWAIGAGDLNSYVGLGNVAATGDTTLTADANRGTFGSASTTYQVSWSGIMTMTYNFLLHSAGSFGSGNSQLALTLDFGTLFLGDSASLGFDIFNLVGDRVGLDLDSIVGSGDTGMFNIGSCAFTALAANGSHHCTAGFNASSAGAFGASYVFNLSDADVGASDSRRGQTLTLNLRGIVGLAPTNVPEPASLALLGVGLAGLGLARRKRR